MAWYLPLWLMCWTLGGLFAAYRMAITYQEHDWILLLWVVPWAFGVVYTLYAWLWNIFGSELLMLVDKRLVCERRVFGHAKEWSFPIGDVTNLRPSGRFHRWLARDSLAPWTLGYGTIAFDVRGKAKRVGMGLSLQEAEGIVAAFKARLI